MANFFGNYFGPGGCVVPPPTPERPVPVPCEPSCLTLCNDDVFSRLRVDYLVVGGSRVAWELVSSMQDAGPYYFQLQIGRHGVEDDDWTTIGAPVVDGSYAIDPEHRLWGMTQWAFYRVRLQTNSNVYFSRPQPPWGNLSQLDWNLVANMQVTQKLSFMHEGVPGLLLKRKVYGTKCTECTDFQTGEVTVSDCPSCYGTGFEGGYWAGPSCCYTKMSLPKRREQRDGGQARGMVNDIAIQAEMLAEPFLSEEDVWINRDTDERWFIHEISHKVEWRSYPVVLNVEMRKIPFSHLIYQFPRPT